jgi:hypothetical protein
MTKTKTIYDKLLPEVKLSLRTSAKKYEYAKRLKYRLMSETIWQNLAISDIADLCSYGNLYTYQLGSYDIMYGDKFLIKS